jgi:ammonium transporter Rh
MYNTVSSALDANSYGLMPVSNMPVSNNDNDKQPTTDWSRLALFVALMQVVLLGLFLRFVQYPTSFSSQDDVQYVFYLNVTIMMLVGFGFLMTFQKLNPLTAVGMTFLVTTICVPWAVLTGRFFASAAGNIGEYPGVVDSNSTLWEPVTLNINALLQGNFAAAAVLISFGALIGKISPSQLALMTFLEVPLYSFNKEVLCIKLFGTLDMGGTIFIHLFGAYFGLAAAYMLGKPPPSENEDASRVSDVFSLIGTVFLWIYWPSFNGATAGVGEEQQLLTTINTVMALCASCLTTFVVSAILNKRISTVDIQNATLAGGVAVGASSNLQITPGVAMFVGMLAAALSTVGFNRLQSVLETKFGLHDSCGVHNLHGMPALLGSIVVSIAVSISATRGDVHYPKGDYQSGAQLAGAGITLMFALVSGTIVGKVLKVCSSSKRNFEPFEDAEWWTVAEKKC